MRASSPKPKKSIALTRQGAPTVFYSGVANFLESRFGSHLRVQARPEKRTLTRRLPKTARDLALLLTLCTLASCDSATAFLPEYPSIDILIENGDVVDGLGSDPVQADVVIVGDSIVFVGDAAFSEDDLVQRVARRIDAAGRVVTPGFIDLHSHGDPLETPQFQNFLAMGVTTISLGQDGFSPELEDLPGWINKVNAARPGVNIISFAGHNTLRELSGVGYDSVPAKDKLQLMENMLERAMAGGAFGMTTGLEYRPGEFSRKEELRSLAKIVGRNEGIIMSHMRDEDD